MNTDMTEFRNQEGLNRALNKCRAAMREFVFDHLENKVQAETVEELIERELGRESHNIDIKGILDIFLNSYFWSSFFDQRFGYNPQLRREQYDIRSVTRMIVNARNKAAHLGMEDLDTEFTRTHLFLIADVLGEINKLDARREVENIRNELFPDGDQERLKIVEVEKTELEKRLKITSDQLKDVEKENAAYKKRIGTIPDQLKAANTEKTKYEKVIKAASNQLATLKKDNAQLEERLEVTSTRLEEVEEELATLKKDNTQLEERLQTTLVQLEKVEEELADCQKPLPPNPDPPDSITFQGTTFTRHLNEYHVAGDDISQGFWYYWQSQGREGKQEMRDAGWSVEKVNGEWEVTISPEDFRAWIEYEVTKLNNLFNSPQNEEPSTQSTHPSYERTSLPTVKEMVQPALEVFEDREEHRRVEMINHLTEHFRLSDNQRSYLSKTGQVEKHLMNKGLIERTRTGYYRITARGRKKVRTR